MREHVESFVTEDGALTASRERGEEMGCTPIGPAGAAALRFLAGVLAARAVVEVGTGTGTSGLCLLRGMATDGVLTSIDVEPEYQRAARQAFRQAGFPPSRYRLIIGRALEVLPRLTDSAYDLVFIDAAQHEYPRYLEVGTRLLRAGGVIAFNNALPNSQPTQYRDSSAAALRTLRTLVRNDDTLLPLMLPLGDGLLLALRAQP
ncbi:MAG TPA: O-methyltransferase [Pseudonocardiaceae bacterium]|nr:O-methyltransferase [Pseudonocardiaceae bacterium]